MKAKKSNDKVILKKMKYKGLNYHFDEISQSWFLKYQLNYHEICICLMP